MILPLLSRFRIISFSEIVGAEEEGIGDGNKKKKINTLEKKKKRWKRKTKIKEILKFE